MTKQPPPNDPYLAREQEKYENPIPSREFIMDMLAERGVLMNMDAIAEALKLADEDSLEALRRRLRAMERDGQLIRNRRGDYGLANKMDMVVGRIIGHPDGFGFLVPDEGGDDLFMGAREMRALFPNDRVMARVTGVDRRGRREGAVVEVLERNTQRIVGRFHQEGTFAFVVPENRRIAQDILLEPDGGLVVQPGQFVVVDIVHQPSRYRQAVGRVVEIVGDHMAPGMEIDVAIRAHGLPLEWSEGVLQEIAQLKEEVPDSAGQGREDIRQLPLVTIDGEDARDFDAAVYCEPAGSGWRLYVAIADVSAYVKPGTALDDSAIERGNSVYFPERVIPMLPEILSNGLCSINPKVNRLCMVCAMDFDARGVMHQYRFFKGFMRSHARLTYNQVNAMLVEGDTALQAQYQDLQPHLQNLFTLYKVLQGQRAQRGAIEFESTETRIVFSETRKIERIVPVVRNDAHRLIEECMIAANVAAAHYLEKCEIPTLYRVHEGPSNEKLSDLREFLAELGLSLGGGDEPAAKDYAKLLDKVRTRPDAHLIQTVMLRSLSQAVYSPDNVGHFGLAHEYYAHFTSPIRRYPDLLVHRAIKFGFKGKSPQSFRYSHGDMVSMGEHCSMTERRADDATRDAIDWLRCEYMLDKVEGTFDGIITGVTNFGLFVQLNEIYVEGLIHVTGLENDYYHFDPSKHRLIGDHSRHVFRLGDPITVKVARVDLDERKIDFDLVNHVSSMGRDKVKLPEGAKTPGRKPHGEGRPRGKGKGKESDGGGKPKRKSSRRKRSKR